MPTWSHRLKSLWVLDRVLQCGSFARAAEQLNVSQSAVSQQIRLLEADLGVLFDRSSRELRPTEMALRLGASLRKGFDQIEEGMSAIRRCQCEVRISVLPSFASAWLIPRLHRFTTQQPEIELQLSLGMEVTDFSTSNMDAGIRLAEKPPEDLIAHELGGDEVLLVASPQTRSELGEQLSFSQLRNLTLVHDDCAGAYSWESWCEAARDQGAIQSAIEVGRRVLISDASQVIRSALGGGCIALVRRLLALDELSSGALVPLFKVRLPLRYRYFLVMPPRSRNHPALHAFQDWLQGELALCYREWEDSPVS